MERLSFSMPMGSISPTAPLIPAQRTKRMDCWSTVVGEAMTQATRAQATNAADDPARLLPQGSHRFWAPKSMPKSAAEGSPNL